MNGQPKLAKAEDLIMLGNAVAELRRALAIFNEQMALAVKVLQEHEDRLEQHVEAIKDIRECIVKHENRLRAAGE